MTIRIAAPQLEQGSFATSYIPTTNATVTRALDSLSIPSGAWGNATTGTFYVEAPKSLNQGVSSRYYAFINGNAQVSLINGTNVGGYVTDSSGTSIASFNSAALTTGTTFKDALAYTDNDFSEVVNGGTPMTDTSGTMSSLSTLVIGNNSGGGTRSINSSISKLKYYPVRVPNAQSQLLTQ